MVVVVPPTPLSPAIEARCLGLGPRLDLESVVDFGLSCRPWTRRAWAAIENSEVLLLLCSLSTCRSQSIAGLGSKEDFPPPTIPVSKRTL